MKNYQYNEKPTDVQNIGQDIDGAARHHRNTYETPEELRRKAFKKSSGKALKALQAEYEAKLVEALHQSTEAGKAVLCEYELRKAVMSCELLDGVTINSLSDFRTYVLGLPYGDERELLRKKYNQANRKCHAVKYRVRPIELKDYFKPKTKDSFREVNGHQVNWSTKSASFDKAFLAARVKGVQFGNTITENERIYVSEKLIEAIKIMDRYFTIDFKSLGFSYGARGKAGSVAHYQDSAKVLAFNRGCDGAFIHELGHAIDYSLGLVSRNLPYEIRSKYRAKLEAKQIPNLHYYMKPVEIFARLFEAYVKATVVEATSYMIFNMTDSTLPDLDAEAIAWLGSVLKPIMKVEV